MKHAARQPEGSRRSLAGGRAQGHRQDGQCARHRRHDHARRGGELAVVRGAIAGLAMWLAASATRTCATAAPSAARSPTTIPQPTIPPALLALGATIGTNKREIKADDFFKGLFSTALGTARSSPRISFPQPDQVRLRQVRQPGLALCARRRCRGTDGEASARRRDGRRQQRRLPPQGDGGGARKNWSAQALANLSTPAADMMSDIHADAAYRAHLVGVMARRAVAAA